MKNNYIQDKMDIEEINANENRKIWMPPELEILDGRKTYGGDIGGKGEEHEYDFDHEPS